MATKNTDESRNQTVRLGEREVLRLNALLSTLERFNNGYDALMSPELTKNLREFQDAFDPFTVDGTYKITT